MMSASKLGLLRNYPVIRTARTWASLHVGQGWLPDALTLDRRQSVGVRLSIEPVKDTVACGPALHARNQAWECGSLC